MARSARTMKRSRKRVLSFSEIQCDGLSAEEQARTAERMELYDSLSEPERALVQEFGLAKAYHAIRLHYGRLEEAQRFLLAQRSAALPVNVRGNIT